MGWQPIETAPRDGRNILAVGRNFGDGGFHHEVVQWVQDERTPEQRRAEQGTNFSGWYTDDGDGDYPLLRLTHWMPLPPHPAQEG